MVAVGLGRRLTAEAAKRAALGAGARILRTYAYELTEKDLDEIDQLRPDILLLSGGTDGGNRLNLVENARHLSHLRHRPPIVIAGNSEVQEEAAQALADFEVYRTENVMPAVNVLHADPARAVIRSIFMDHIIHAKGLDVVTQRLGPILMPTPEAVLRAAHLLSVGTTAVPGIGPLLLVDIGGATTDVHSIGEGRVRGATVDVDGREVELRYEGLEEPFDKRTVEGDLGMRYSSLSLLESLGEGALQAIYPADYRAAVDRRTANTRFIPTNAEEKRIDRALARGAAQAALERHAGTLRRSYDGTRTLYYLSGKDLRAFHTLIGTGGIIVNDAHPEEILRPVQAPLFPVDPALYVDRAYILSAMGLLSTEAPEAALRLMRKSLCPVSERGSLVSPKENTL